MGQVRKDGSSWFYIAELGKDPVTGQRKRKKKRGFHTKREAEKALAQVEAAVIQGDYIEPSNVLFKDYLADWFKVKRTTIGSQTAKNYENYLENRIIPLLGHYSLSKLNTMVLQNYVLSQKEEGLASATIKKLYSIINNALEHAKKLELISKNPASNIQLPKIEKKEMHVWEEENIHTFLNVAKNDRLFAAFHLAIGTGMRQEEILGLRWKDVDLEESTLYIRQTLSRDGKEFLVGAKTTSSVRSVRLASDTVAVLKKHRLMVISEKLQQGNDYVNLDLVICTTKGTQVIASNLRRTFERLIEEAKVPKIRFHDLRHTHATYLFSKGTHAKVISERLGHSNIKITLDTYSHVLPNMQDEAAKQIDSLFSKSQ